jgi:hypothetical protein
MMMLKNRRTELYLLLVSVGIYAFRSFEGVALPYDLRVLFSLLIKFCPFLEFIRYIHVRINGFNGTFVHAGVTIDAGFRINV